MRVSVSVYVVVMATIAQVYHQKHRHRLTDSHLFGSDFRLDNVFDAIVMTFADIYCSDCHHWVCEAMRETEAKASAVLAVSACFAYSPSAEPILDGLSVSVPKASIYGLIGPSGCGKTYDSHWISNIIRNCNFNIILISLLNYLERIYKIET